MTSRISTTLLIAALGLGLSGCGDEGKSSQVEVTILPESPIIITGDGKDADGNTLTAPWFSYRVLINNQSDSALTIVSVKATITLSEYGSTPTNYDFPASKLNYTTAAGINCTYLTLGEFAKNTSGPLVGKLTDAGLAGTCAQDLAFSIAPNTLTKPRDPKTKNYRYRVEIEPQGWFGDRDNPTDRFVKKMVIYTR